MATGNVATLVESRRAIRPEVRALKSDEVWRWLRRMHRRSTWKQLRRRYCDGGWWPHGQDRALFDPAKTSTTRYRYRGTVIASPWPATDEKTHHVTPTGLVESPVH
jgi:RNA-directed DNA polymerase